MPNVATTKKSSKKKITQAAAQVEDDMEPLGPVFLEDDEDDEGSLPLAKQPAARNVGSLLSSDPNDPNDDDGDDSKDLGSDAEVVEAAPSEPHAAVLYWREAKRVGPAHAKATVLRKLGKRLKRHMEALSRWGQSEGTPVSAAVAQLNGACAMLLDAAGSLDSLPVGWSPPSSEKTAGGGKALAEGSKVSVKESARKDYDGALEPEEMTGLTVVRHEKGKSKVACKTADGAKVVISRAHLVSEG